MDKTAVLGAALAMLMVSTPISAAYVYQVNGRISSTNGDGDPYAVEGAYLALNMTITPDTDSDTQLSDGEILTKALAQSSQLVIENRPSGLSDIEVSATPGGVDFPGYIGLYNNYWPLSPGSPTFDGLYLEAAFFSGPDPMLVSFSARYDSLWPGATFPSHPEIADDLSLFKDVLLSLRIRDDASSYRLTDVSIAMSQTDLGSPLPIPAAAWLFATAIGVFGYTARRKTPV